MAQNKITGIYKIISPSNKVYVGQALDCLNRNKQYASLRCKSQRKLYNSLIKYGWENHKFEIIHVCNPEELNELEKYYSILFNCLSVNQGLNLKEAGGSLGKFSEESKNKMREAQKKLYANGYVAPATGTDRRFLGMYGKKHSENTKQKHSQKMKGRISWNKGIPQSETQKRRHSEFMKGRKPPNLGKILTIEQRIKAGNGSRGRVQGNDEKYKRAKSLLKIILDTNTGVYYIGLQDAADSINMKKERLSARLNGRVKNKTGLIFTKK